MNAFNQVLGHLAGFRRLGASFFYECTEPAEQVSHNETGLQGHSTHFVDLERILINQYNQ